MVLLRWNHGRTQHVALPIPRRKRRHEFGGLKDQVRVLLEPSPVGLGTAAQFRHRDDVRLLPDEQRADGDGLSRPSGLQYQFEATLQQGVRLHIGKCAACHQCISRWNFPYQLLQVNPVSCGGIDPVHWIAVRYWDKTMRRSDSFARESPACSSRAPPIDQNRCQCDSLAAKTSPVGLCASRGAKAHTNSTRSPRGRRTNVCGPSGSNDPSPAQEIADE